MCSYYNVTKKISALSHSFCANIDELLFVNCNVSIDSISLGRKYNQNKDSIIKKKIRTFSIFVQIELIDHGS